MKKLLKILTTIAAVLAAALLMATCKQFIDDPEEFLSYWSSEVVPINFSINESSQKSNDGALCIPSANDVTLTIKLRNPKNFTLVTPTSSADAGKIINFPGLSTQPEHGTDYTLTKTAPDTLQLTYKESFLKAHEWSNGGIGPEITLISTDGRKFSKKFSLNIEANTPPPKIGDITIAKTNEVDPHYVLCFTVDALVMNTTIPGGKLHKDLGLVIAKEGGEPTTIPLPIGSPGFAVVPADGLLPSALQIIDPVPSGIWKVCFKTGTKLTESTLPQKYTVRLIDRKGLSSAPKEAETLGYIASGGSSTDAWKNLKQAVESATSDGGVITVTGNVTATKHLGNNGAISVTTSLTIKGAGLTPVLNANKNADGKPAHRIFTVENGGELMLENITLTAGMATGASTAPLEEKCGGGIFVKEGGKAKLKNCTIKNCKADKFGGGICSEGELTLYGGTIGGSLPNANKAMLGGGICIQKNGSLTLKTTTISRNEADYGGAICVRESGSVSMESGSLMTNTASISGGGVDVDDSASFTMTGGEIKTNEANSGGGGVYAHSGTFTLSDIASIESNTAKGRNGGGIYVDSTGTLVIKGGSIKLNMATKTTGGVGNGGGVYVYGYGSFKGKLNMIGGSIEGNGAGKEGSNYYGSGGGVYIDGGTFTMTGGEIKTNNAKNGGGVALDEGGTLELSGSGKIINNTAAGGGGGIAVLHGTFTMSKGKVIGNTAAQEGGGVYVDANSTFKMHGGTIENNTSTLGKGVYVAGGDGTPTMLDANFIMGGEACVGNWVAGTLQDGNDVYLGENLHGGELVSIEIDKDNPITKSKVACITPKSYSPDETVLMMSDGSTDVGDYNDKFTVTLDGFTQWYVDSNGKLKN
ncbi:right-handed parallel beta-helix repeat-containing protein [Treponema putidum]|uniref:right-handed parallel beta-helix repeat-containing protein n=1 Tax=Treponema putidum TaxID=221027 RepID=UPI0006786B77|nr:right-handed parallel beta-helix repeat-containing protein [Treponema putidum]TWI74229.1 putative outer membrane repeat protein [Treponema putidum]